MHSQQPAELNDPDRQPGPRDHWPRLAPPDSQHALYRWVKEDPKEPTQSVLYLFSGSEPSAESPVEFLHNHIDGLLDLDLEKLQGARDREHARELLHEMVEELRGYDFPDWPWLGARAQRAIMRHWWTAARLLLLGTVAWWWVLRPLLLRNP